MFTFPHARSQALGVLHTCMYCTVCAASLANKADMYKFTYAAGVCRAGCYTVRKQLAALAYIDGDKEEGTAQLMRIDELPDFCYT